MNKKLLAAAMATVAGLALIGVAANGQTVRNASILTDVQVPSKVDNFRLADQNSKSHELYYFKNAKAVVIITQANGAKVMESAAPAIKALKDKYAAQGVVFLMLNSSPNDQPAVIAAEMQKVGLDVPVMIDQAQLVGESLGVTRVAQAFVVQPKTWSVVYNGPIDDRFAGATASSASKAAKPYVADAIDSLLSGKPLTTISAKLETPLIAFPQRDRTAEHAKISYSTDVAPILAKNCVACHSEGGIAPFAMDSYDRIKMFAPMIREAIRTDRMPPYNADPHVGKFSDDMNLSVADTQTLVHWVEAGAPRGEGVDLLKASAKPAADWELGEPDMILNMPAFTIPAAGVVDYQRPAITIPVPEDRYVRAVTFNVGERKGVHHIVAPFGTYAVGGETIRLAPNQGMLVTPGQKITPSVHYTPFGKEVSDTTRIGLYFYPKEKPPEKIRRTLVITNPSLEIPAGEARHSEVAYGTIKHDATLYSVFMHAHYRGESAQVYVQKPGRKEELIISLPKFDFSWQRTYPLSQPIDLPAGTRIITRTDYDNSTSNPANPDPSKTIIWGEQSWEEMQYTEVSLTWKDETSANLKPEYMTEFTETRALGSLDSNLDGKLAKSEMRGRLGKVALPEFDKLDLDKDGQLTEDEARALIPLLTKALSSSDQDL